MSSKLYFVEMLCGFTVAGGYVSEQEMAIAMIEQAVDDWPSSLTVAEDARLSEVPREVGEPDADDEVGGGQAVSSAGSPLDAAPAAQSLSSSSSAAPAVASSSSSAPPAADAPNEPVAGGVSFEGVSWSPPDAGGYITRHGRIIGRMTTFRNNLSVRCSMHDCSIAVNNSVPLEEAVAWVLQGTPIPPDLPYSERSALKTKLKTEHMKAPRPKPRPKAPPRAGPPGAA